MCAPGRPFSKAWGNPRACGFSLLELILVLALAGLLAAVVIPSLPGALESSRLKGAAVEVRSVFTLARTLAVSEARIRSVAFDLASGEYGIERDGRKWVMPEGIRIAAFRLGGADKESGVVRVRFYPDGSADEAEVAISSSGGAGMKVIVEPLTGIAAEGT